LRTVSDQLVKKLAQLLVAFRRRRPLDVDDIHALNLQAFGKFPQAEVHCHWAFSEQLVKPRNHLVTQGVNPLTSEPAKYAAWALLGKTTTFADSSNLICDFRS